MKSAIPPLSHGAPPVRTGEATASGDLPVTQPIDISGLSIVRWDAPPGSAAADLTVPHRGLR